MSSDSLPESGFLWIMWLIVGGSAGADAVNMCRGFYAGVCINEPLSPFSTYLDLHPGSFVSSSRSKHHQEETHLNCSPFFPLVMFYHITLVVLAFRQHFRGNTGVWIKGITEVVCNSRVPLTTYATQYSLVGTPAPIAQQQTAGSDIQPVSPYPQSQASSTLVSPTTYATQYRPVGTLIGTPAPVAQQRTAGSDIQPVRPHPQAPSTLVTPATSPYAQV